MICLTVLHSGNYSVIGPIYIASKEIALLQPFPGKDAVNVESKEIEIDGEKVMTTPVNEPAVPPTTVVSIKSGLQFRVLQPVAAILAAIGESFPREVATS